MWHHRPWRQRNVAKSRVGRLKLLWTLVRILNYMAPPPVRCWFAHWPNNNNRPHIDWSVPPPQLYFLWYNHSSETQITSIPGFGLFITESPTVLPFITFCVLQLKRTSSQLCRHHQRRQGSSAPLPCTPCDNKPFHFTLCNSQYVTTNYKSPLELTLTLIEMLK